MDHLEEVIQQTIVDALGLSISPDSIAKDAPLFGAEAAGGIGLDSLNSLEILAALSDKFQSPLDTIQASDFFSVSTLADYLRCEIHEKAEAPRLG